MNINLSASERGFHHLERFLARSGPVHSLCVVLLRYWVCVHYVCVVLVRYWVCVHRVCCVSEVLGVCT